MFKNILCFGLILIFSTWIFAQDGHVVFKSMELKGRASPDSPVFMLSEAAATSASPVIVSIPGRKLESADRVNRVNLQKDWLAANVPADYKLQIRVLAGCHLVRFGEYPYCDVYTFVDPKDNSRHDYYIYIGNWP